MKLISILLFPGLVLLSSCAITLEKEGHTSRIQGTSNIDIPDLGVVVGDCIPANENNFVIDVRKNNYSGIVHLPGLYLLINGESIGIPKPASGTFGRYTYNSCDIPADGIIRFRYMFKYESGLGVSGPPNIKRIFYPSDSYMQDTLQYYSNSSYSSISWESGDKQVIPLVNTNYNGLSSILRKTYALNQSGLTAISSFTLKSDLVQLGALIPVVNAPKVYDRETGAELTNFTVTPLSGAYPVHFPNNATGNGEAEFRLNYNDQPASVARVYKIKIVFPRTFYLVNSEFTIWADIDITGSS